MLALTLNGNEQYQEAVPYYKRAIEKLEEMGQDSTAVRMRIGYISVLANTGKYREALETARPVREGPAVCLNRSSCQPRLVDFRLLNRSGNVATPASHVNEHSLR